MRTLSPTQFSTSTNAPMGRNVEQLLRPDGVSSDRWVRRVVAVIVCVGVGGFGVWEFVHSNNAQDRRAAVSSGDGGGGGLCAIADRAVIAEFLSRLNFEVELAKASGRDALISIVSEQVESPKSQRLRALLHTHRVFVSPLTEEWSKPWGEATGDGTVLAFARAKSDTREAKAETVIFYRSGQHARTDMALAPPPSEIPWSDEAIELGVTKSVVTVKTVRHDDDPVIGR